MALDLFAGIPVVDYDAARRWYERMLGTPPTFLPNEVEAVWEVAEHRYLFIEVRPADAGHAMHTLFVDDLDARVAAAAGRGVVAEATEVYGNGVRKVVYRDPDGNEISLGGAADQG